MFSSRYSDRKIDKKNVLGSAGSEFSILVKINCKINKQKLIWVVQFLDFFMGCDLGNICTKAE
jgi:hypothetical protein